MQKGAVMSEKKKKLVAYHEAGHALVGALMPEYDPVTKISIVPRGAAGGLTFFAPSEERLESGLYSRNVRPLSLRRCSCIRLGRRVHWRPCSMHGRTIPDARRVGAVPGEPDGGCAGRSHCGGAHLR